MRTRADRATAIDPFLAGVKNLVRRMIVKASTKALWQLGGFDAPDMREVIKAELFGGIGFYARPSRTGKPEAIVVMIGADAKTPAIVATRDEKTRAAIAGSLAEGETAVFNDKAIMVFRANGSVEVRSQIGSSGPLVPLSEFLNHSHTSFGAPPTEIAPTIPPGFQGTKVLKGE